MRPRPDTITRRKRERTVVRNALDAHRSDAPSLRKVITAARALDQLMMLTTDGVYRVTIEAPTGGFGGQPHVPGWEELYEVAEGWRE